MLFIEKINNLQKEFGKQANDVYNILTAISRLPTNEQITTDNLNFLREDVNSKISTYFPNITVEDLIVTGQEDSNQITVTLKYSVINTNITDTLEIQL